MDHKDAYLSKPWLKYYPEGVPEEVDIPDISVPDLFDQMAEIRGDREIEFLLAERSPSPSYRTVATGSDFVQVESDDAGAAEPFRTRLRSHGGLLDAPVEDMGFHGIFRRIDAPAVLAR